MNKRSWLVILLVFIGGTVAQCAVLKRSDVVFMYQADAKTYADYGATALGWGGKPTAKALEEAKGVKFFGSVGMVTEFSRYYERFPDTYEQGLCRDINGKPVKVPWLTDHQHKGVPFWWCCTQQPLFRQYIQERVVETIKAGAEGLHVDDHMGTSGGLWLGICFCDRCNSGFARYLARLEPSELQRLAIEKPEGFNFRDTVQSWLSLDGNKKPAQHPVWSHFVTYQCRAAAEFMMSLRELAAKTAGHPVPVGANAGLLWPRHLADYKAVDLFSAETDHHAAARKFSDTPILAYRLADAVSRPYAATASGQDWAYIKEQNLHGLVRGWIALAYASGHFLMAPQRQWCYTPEKGTHWYNGPKEKFAPMYQFVRKNAAFLDDYDTYADVGVVLPHRAFVKDPSRWFGLCNQLAASNISYRILFAGDEIVDHPLIAKELDACESLLVPDRDNLLPGDRELLQKRMAKNGIFSTAKEVFTAVRPAVQVTSTDLVRVLPRVTAGGAVIHLLNYAYDASHDSVTPLKSVKVKLDAGALGVPQAKSVQLVPLEGASATLRLTNGEVEVPELGLWALLIFKNE